MENQEWSNWCTQILRDITQHWRQGWNHYDDLPHTHQKQCSLLSNRDSNWKRKCWVLESATLLKIFVRSNQTHFSIAKIFYNFTSCQLTTISPADKVRNLLGYFLAWQARKKKWQCLSRRHPSISNCKTPSQAVKIVCR